MQYFNIDDDTPRNRTTLIDVRTADATGLQVCVKAADRAGAAADDAERDKNNKWLRHTVPQGLDFVPLTFESGGRIGEAALGFIDRLSYAAAGSTTDRAAYVTYALQRLRALTVKGVAQIILSRPSSRDAPGGTALRGAFPLAPSLPRGACRPYTTPVVSPRVRLPTWLRAYSESCAPLDLNSPPWGPGVATRGPTLFTNLP